MLIVGIDEVGRGCWAGPVVAGAVILGNSIVGLKDSKLLSKNQREVLAIQIEASALAIGLGWVEPKELDKVGLTEAVRLAMQRALLQIELTYGEIIIDGNYNFLADNPKSKAIIKADMTIAAVSAASIVAKVARDNYMSEASDLYPEYGFSKHVGYGTKLHIEKLKLHGVSEIHRLSYKPIKAMMDTGLYD
jgi:ribonuclease HII